MKLLGLSTIHKSMLAALSAVLILTGCSNSNFRGGATQGNVESASSENAVSDNGITTTPIESSDLSIPSALKPKPDLLIAQFPTAVLKNAETQFTLDLKDISATVALKEDFSNKTEKFVQNTRTATTDAFAQGNAGESKSDSFIQAGKKGQVDILVVVDNSGSMAEEQTNLSTKLNELLVAIKDADWQISVITTSTLVPNNDINNLAFDGQETCASTLIRKTDTTAAADFARAVQAGTSGNGNEQGIRQAVVGLRCPGKTVVRPGSTLAVLIVADEDNCSLDGGDCGVAPWSKETYLINYVENTLNKTVGKDAGFYGIVAPSKALCPTAGNPAPQYIRLFDYKASAPGANYGNICDPNYSTTLNRISENIALLLDNTFTLTNAPDAGTLSVSTKSIAGVTTTISASDFTLVDRALKFNLGKEPANGSTITAAYRINAKPLFSTVTLANDPAINTIAVSINGTPLPIGSFASNGRIISFGTQPPANADVKINYRLNTALANVFQLAGAPLAATVAVKVKNVATTNFTFDAAAKKVTLNPVPLDAEAIDISYDSIDGPKLIYDVLLSAGATNFRLLDGATALPFTLNQADGKLSINAAQHQVGKTLIFTYELPDGAERKFPLAGTPEAGSVNVSMMAGTCAFGKDLTIVGTDLIAKCPVTEKTEFVLSYKYKSLQKSFSLTGVSDPEKGSWTVFYNGLPETNYTRSGSTITLNFEPSLTSRVDILYTFPE